MATILPVLAESDILSDPSRARDLLGRVERALDDGVVALDFTGVNGVAPGFADALLGPLFDRLGETMPDRVSLENCSASVLNDLKSVAERDRPMTAADARPVRRGRHAA